MVPLTPAAIDIIQSIPRLSAFVFPASGKPTHHVSGYSKWKKKLDHVSGIEGWRVHDIRRTAATGMARLKHDPHVVDGVLNHANGTLSRTAKIYNQYAYLDEKRDALVDWSNYLVETVIV